MPTLVAVDLSKKKDGNSLGTKRPFAYLVKIRGHYHAGVVSFDELRGFSSGSIPFNNWMWNPLINPELEGFWEIVDDEERLQETQAAH